MSLCSVFERGAEHLSRERKQAGATVSGQEMIHG